MPRAKGSKRLTQAMRMRPPRRGRTRSEASIRKQIATFKQRRAARLAQLDADASGPGEERRPGRTGDVRLHFTQVHTVTRGCDSPTPTVIDHPPHYGGATNPYEAIKVIEAWGLGFCLGNTLKYISRAGKKGDRLDDLKKARWYLDRAIDPGLAS